MKKQFVLLLSGLFLMVLFSSCFRDHNISISVSDSEDIYQMTAKYPKYKTRKVERMIDEFLEDISSRSYKHRRSDYEITLDDMSVMYLRSDPGKLKIRVDKTENTEACCAKAEEICEEIKRVLTDDN